MGEIEIGCDQTQGREPCFDGKPPQHQGTGTGKCSGNERHIFGGTHSEAVNAFDVAL